MFYINNKHDTAIEINTAHNGTDECFTTDLISADNLLFALSYSNKPITELNSEQIKSILPIYNLSDQLLPLKLNSDTYYILPMKYDSSSDIFLYLPSDEINNLSNIHDLDNLYFAVFNAEEQDIAGELQLDLIADMEQYSNYGKILLKLNLKQYKKYGKKWICKKDIDIPYATGSMFSKNNKLNKAIKQYTNISDFNSDEWSIIVDKKLEKAHRSAIKSRINNMSIKEKFYVRKSHLKLNQIYKIMNDNCCDLINWSDVKSDKKKNE